MTTKSQNETPGMAGRVQDASAISGNKPERSDWFMDLALGMFIHWNIDSQLGSVISHSMVGASADYLNRYINDLPQTFYPYKFDPIEWARLAKTCGVKYVVFTTKHHSGFCMFQTETTPFNIMNTPFGRDITREVVEAFRQFDIRIGYYFSPDDFWILHQQGHDISRARPEANPLNNPELMAHNQAQIRELLTNYGPIDMIFFDGVAEGLKQLAWELQPDIVVTRGDMGTPEQNIPDEPMPGPWEACFTLGTQWSYKPTNDDYKSGTKLIEMLVETRAKGGNLLLNVGPMANGEICLDESDRITEMGLWNFVNHEAIYNIRPWHIIREDNIWYTKHKDEDTVFAIVTQPNWPKGKRLHFTLTKVKATKNSTVDILGQTSRVLEYNPDVDPQLYWSQDDVGLHISAMRTQRLYNNSQWPNAVVLKITNATF
ncbi:MAG: alpha-L-fucosidase [Chloroflexota bacterium]